MSEDRPPLPPFNRESAIQKVRAAENAWNSCDPERVSLAYSTDSYWRNRSEFLKGRLEIVAFLTRKWRRELDYRLIKELVGVRRRSDRRALSLMSSTTISGTGFAPTATRTGSSTGMA